MLTQIKLYDGDNYNGYEPKTTEFFQSIIKSGWVVFDCGAKTGYFSLLFSELCGENGVVHSFEPTKTFDMLLENIEFNKVTNIIPNNIALGEKSGIYEENIYRIWGKPAEKLNYPFITIDEYVSQNNIDKIDLIKIDVDSFDFEVLKGATNTISTLKPIITVELNHALHIRNATESEVIDWLKIKKYTLERITDGENHTFFPIN